jgi:hypothetical protein
MKGRRANGQNSSPVGASAILLVHVLGDFFSTAFKKQVYEEVDFVKDYVS